MLLAALLGGASPAFAQRWVTSWAAADQGPYPVGSPAAQPDLQFAVPDAATGAKDQTLRLILKPSLWGNRVRLRVSNAFGTKPLAVDGVFIGLQTSGAAIMPGSNRAVTFGGRKAATIQPGAVVWSDSVSLPWANNPAAPELLGRKLAVSIHVAGESGPMTWHAQAMQTSYMTMPGAGALGEFEDESAFPNSTTSWFLLDALDVQPPPETGVVVCFGDGLTDGTNTTLNGDDAWPDVLARRLQAAGLTMAVANAAIAGNQVTFPTEYTAAKPAPGGPSAVARLTRDVLGLSGVTHVIWLEGIGDLGPDGGASVEQVEDALRAGVKRLREKLPKVKVIGATLTSVAGAKLEGYAIGAVEAKRKALNAFIRNNGGLFDGVVDFDKATSDPQSGALRSEFVPDSTVGGPGDGLHPNRAGQLAMGEAVDLRLLHAAPPGPARRPRPAPAQVPGPSGPSPAEGRAPD